MPRTKISEFSATPANNTDIDSINIAEGCAPSGINDAIRELMAQLKDFQTGAVGDSFNGPIGTSTAAAGAFTTLSASSTLAVTGVATLTAQPILSSLTASRAVFTDASKGLVSNAITGTGNVVMSTSPTLVTPVLGAATGTSFQGIIGNVTPAAGNFTTLGASSTATLNTLASSGATLTGGTINGMTIGATTATTGAFTTLTTSSTVTHNGGTANGVTYLNGSKVLTSGSAIVFDGTNLGVGTASPDTLGRLTTEGSGNSLNVSRTSGVTGRAGWISQNTAETIRLFSEVYGASATNTGFGLTLAGYGVIQTQGTASNGLVIGTGTNDPLIFGQNDTEGMRLTSTGLGIGTSSPSSRLTVAGGYVTLTGTSNNHNIAQGTGWVWTSDGTASGTVRGGIYAQSDSTLSLFGGSTVSSQLTLNSSGNLGLGVTPSAWGSIFDAAQIGNYGAFVAGRADSSNQLHLGTNSYYNGTNWIYTNTSTATRYVQASGAHEWYTAASGTAGNAITFTQAMTLDASGNLLVGRTSRVVTETFSSTGYGLFGGATVQGIIGDAGSGLVSVGAYSNHGVEFRTNNTERARIDTSGNLLVGTDNPAIDSGVGIKFLNDTNKHVSVVSSSSTNAGGESFVMYSTTAAAYRFYVAWGGTINATSITISAISDQRLKENVRDIDTGLDSIMALKPRRFDWKEGKGQDKKNVAGFIAQEFEDVFPECVGVSRAGEDGIEYKNINHETLIPTLVKAIQELKAEFDAYKASHP
jgi:hypothetical protein